MDWQSTAKRYAIACFLTENPVDAEGYGDTPPQCFDDLQSAKKWAEKAINAGRFKYLVLWDGLSGEWIWVEDFRAYPRKSPNS